ncbi:MULTISPECIES: anthranilate phosphoribosyltransferase [unclassified Actinomyces]|uniref:anthranilate phosphoribosyltransferase n=1 Tax=unclassified Actinomyces TaxID=2609248 RepID=UPI0013A6FFE5|nr:MULTISPECIES: anthranilate phosphoribosyltransferase [unclassified Actinomyces]MBW3070109.1 anthranilate phosphoribosyltransferase [Actinomyces sp. 594]NDR52518.1 anthranilate phosphoribosyltransferase [Actinomyces sp. 565]
MNPAPTENNAMNTAVNEAVSNADAADSAPAIAHAEDAHRLLREVIQGKRLTQDETGIVFAALGAGDLSEAETAALLAALHARGETADEVAGAASAFRDAARAFPEVTFPLVDVVGTGGDGVGTINISTGAGIVAASMGISVAKHGNRAVSSKTGAADVVAALGLPLDVTPEQAVEILARDHFTFLFAQAYHPAMRHVAPIRKALATPTIFNVLGPLLNPAHLTYQLMGVANPDILDMIAQTMVKLGRKRALIVHGAGTDEIAVHGITQVREATPRGVKAYEVTPEELGVRTYALEDVLGGEPTENAALLREVFAGRGEPAHRDAIAVNAGALLYLAGPADNLADGTRMALEQLASGRVAEHLDSMTKAAAEDEAR